MRAQTQQALAEHEQRRKPQQDRNQHEREYSTPIQRAPAQIPLYIEPEPPPQGPRRRRDREQERQRGVLIIDFA